MTTNRITAKSVADLISIPRIMLGFDPAESVVVLGITGTRVEFCARMDVDHVENGRDAVAAQINNATTRANICEVVAMGFSADPAEVATTMAPLIEALDAVVIECLAVSPTHWWNVIGDGLVGDAAAYDAKTTTPSLQAVVAGEVVQEDRSAAVAAVQGPRRSDEDYAALVALHTTASKEVAAMTEQQHNEAAAELVNRTDALTDTEGARLTALMNTAEGAGDVLNSMTLANADTYRARLAEARRITPAPVAAGVVALLGMACWLSGEGAQFADCLTQLERLDAEHPVGRILATIHRNAVPPTGWGH